jgi:phosphoglycolate phosphatase
VWYFPGVSSGIQAVIFDLDGTLADSLADIGGAMNDTLRDRGWPQHPIDDYKQFVGEGIEVLVTRASPSLSEPMVKEVVAQYRAHYAERADRNTAPYSGIPEMLDALAAKRLPIAVLSNKRDDFTKGLVQRVFPKWTFAVVRGERTGTPRKPDPTAALELARELGLPPKQIAFVGDTPIDVRTAIAAGMKGVAVTWGFRGEEELRASGAVNVIHRPAELLAHLA